MLASELIKKTVNNLGFVLEPNNDDSAVIVTLGGQKVFYFAVPSLPEEEVRRQFAEYIKAKGEKNNVSYPRHEFDYHSGKEE